MGRWRSSRLDELPGYKRSASLRATPLVTSMTTISGLIWPPSMKAAKIVVPESVVLRTITRETRLIHASGFPIVAI